MAVNLYSQPLSNIFKENKLNSLFEHFLVYRESSSINSAEAIFQKNYFGFEHSTSFGEFGFFYSKNLIDFESKNYKTNLDFGIEFDESLFALDYNYADNIFLIESKIKFITAERKLFLSYDLGFGFNFNMDYLKKIQFSLSSDILPLFLNSTYNNEQFRINHSLQRKSFGLSLELEPEKNSTLKIESKKNIPAVLEVDSKFKSSGEINYSNLGIGYERVKNNFFFAANYFKHEFDLKSDWYTASQSFGNINIHDVVVSTFSITGKYFFSEKELIRTNFLYLNGKANLSGTIQTWPFTSLITSFIINRINYKSNASVSLYSLDFDYNKQFENFSILPGVTYYHVVPNFSLQSWQPAFLVFGVKNFTDNTTQIKSLDLLNLKISMKYTINIFLFEAEFNQFVPIHIERKTSEEIPQPAPVTKTISKVDGGRFFSLKFSTQF